MTPEQRARHAQLTRELAEIRAGLDDLAARIYRYMVQT